MSTKTTTNNPTRLLAQQLVQTESPEVVRHLADIVVRNDNEQLCSPVLEAFGGLTNQLCIDQICQTWLSTRHEGLGNLLEQQGWVASSPDSLSLLTALKSGRLEQLKQGGPEIVIPLLKACQDADPTVAGNARRALESLQNPAAREELFRLIVETDQSLPREIAVAAGYAPPDPQQRALFYILTEQWDQYETLDFDQSLIQAVYQTADEWLQNRIAMLTRQAGRAEFVNILAGGRQQRRLAEMTEGEWEVVFALLTRRRQWAEMWRLAQAAPADWSVRLLQQLGQVNWQPERTDEQAGFAELVALADACEAEGLQVGPLIRCQQTLEGQPGSINDLAISPDGQLLVSGSDDYQTIQLWGLPGGKRLKNLSGHSAEVLSLATSPDGRLLASGSDDGAILLWRLPDGKFLSRLHKLTDPINHLVMSPIPLNGQTGQWLLASGSGDGLVRLWQLPSGRLLKELNGHTAGVLKLATSPDGQLLASGSRDQTIRLWQLPEGEPVQSLSGHTGSVNALAFSPNGRLLASGSLDQTIRLWRLPEGDLFKALHGHNDAVVDLAVKPVGEPLLASGSLDRSVRLWRLSDGKLLQTLSGHQEWVMSLAFSPNGRLLASGSYGHQIKLWASDLSYLAAAPISQTTLADMEWVQETLQKGKVSLAERDWLAFILALMRWRRRFDIEVEEAARHISVGEFDIELELVG
jgi:WD40 repeat protein